jgi:hypothetical protein
LTSATNVSRLDKTTFSVFFTFTLAVGAIRGRSSATVRRGCPSVAFPSRQACSMACRNNVFRASESSDSWYGWTTWPLVTK